MNHITPAEANDKLPGIVLLDCRESLELTIASIEGALHIPMGDIPARFSEIPTDKEVVVFCHTGVRSQSVTQYLTGQGLDRVSNMLGGIDAWSQEVDNSVPRY